MKKITIKLIGTGINNNYQSNIKVYDRNCLIFEGRTFNGKINLYLKKLKKYKIVAEFLNQKIIKCIIVNDCISNYTFIFDSAIVNLTNTVTFFLTDSNYGLPIMKGEIILWQR